MTSTHTKLNPLVTRLKKRYSLTSPNSQKCTMHIEVDLEGSNLEYEVGDSLAVFPHNDPTTVNKIISILGEDKHSLITPKRIEKEISLENFLIKYANISRINKKSLTLIASHLQNQESSSLLTELLDPSKKKELKVFLNNYELWDLLEEFPTQNIPIQEFCDTLTIMPPRFYSIASSMQEVGKEVHLTVALVNYMQNGKTRKGVCSDYLCNQLDINKLDLSCYLQRTKDFHLPSDPNTPIIMIGPGTGVAPFRAFLQERTKNDHTGKNWLFFGERTKENEFLYREYFQNLVQQNRLILTTAFSRDQQEKIYVQHRILEHAKEIWEWIQDKAYVYVCGDAQFMAKDVEKALQNIIAAQGYMAEEEAKAFLKSLRKEGRYLKDVY